MTADMQAIRNTNGNINQSRSTCSIPDRDCVNWSPFNKYKILARNHTLGYLNSLIKYNKGIPIPGKDILYIETGLR